STTAALAERGYIVASSLPAPLERNQRAIHTLVGFHAQECGLARLQEEPRRRAREQRLDAMRQADGRKQAPRLTPPREERGGESPFSSYAARDPRRPRARPRAIRA